MLKQKETILIDEDYLISLLVDINESEKTIDLEVYIFEDDAVGKMVSDALCKAAMRGVKIRVLVDGVGSDTWGGYVTKQMELSGIETRVFHPLPWKFLHWNRSSYLPKYFFNKLYYLLSKINSRNHRKVCIIDKKIIYIGSANINNHLVNNEGSEKAWRETTVRMIDVNIDEVQYAFDKSWNHLPFKQRFRDVFKKMSTESIFHLNYSWHRRYVFHKLLLNRISNCKTRLWVTNAYFVPENRLLKKIIEASRSGVDVRILLPDKSDIFLISVVTSVFYSNLLKAGVSIYEYTPAILHAKLLIVDDWFVMGSSNLNYRSFLHDLEVDVDIKSDECKQSLENQFLIDISQSRKIKLEDVKNKNIFTKIFARFILLIRYWL